MTIRRKQFLIITLVGFILLQSCAAFPRINDKRPNFLIIITDDQRIGSMDFMPVTQSIIFDQGVTFDRGYDTTPLCCPSRASILTGMYDHNNGVRTDDDRLKLPTFVDALHQNGYFTGLVGKYLNSWDGDPRPEFDDWVSFFRGESKYYNPYLNVNGTWSNHDGYVTDILSDYAVQFLDSAAKQPRPFLLYYAPNAPHQPSTPKIEDTHLLDQLPPFRPPSFNQADVSEIPPWFQSQLMGPNGIKFVDNSRRRMLLDLIDLDRTMANVLTTMKNNGQLDDTVIIYLSDNGWFWGEHRLTQKNSYYEEGARVPFAMRYPPLIPKPYVEERMVGNIDIAPTIYQLAGIPIPKDVDGLSWVNLFNGGPWRDSLLIEGWPPRGAYDAIHTERYVYAETKSQGQPTFPEFYDLQLDPYELNNAVNVPAYQSIIASLKQQLPLLIKQSGASNAP